MNRHRAHPLVVVALTGCMALGGCKSLLPSSKTEVVSTWNSYDEAVRSLATIVPYQATRLDVHNEGLDPRTNPAITVLHFGNVLQRFAAAALIKPEDVDPGIRDCLNAGKLCDGYAVVVKKLAQRRVGNFWLDALNFKRETITKGWGVEALLIFVEDRLVYALVGGQPTITDYDVRRNPLGPLQGWGDQALQVLR